MNIKSIIKKYIPTIEFINYGYYANIHNYCQIARINEDKNILKIIIHPLKHLAQLIIIKHIHLIIIYLVIIAVILFS